MLKLKEKINCLATSVVFDEYVPFTAEFESDFMSPPLYWRIGDGKSSLMEIGLNESSGVVLSITLTSIKSENVRNENESYVSRASEIEGLPIFDLSAWKNGKCADEFASNFIDEFNFDLELTLGQDFISVSIIDGMEPTQYIKNDSVIFGVDIDGRLTNVDIVNMSKEDIKTIGSAI